MDIMRFVLICRQTNIDETNILACMQAKRLGARRTIALVNQVEYSGLVDNSDVDLVLNPQEVTVNGILTHLRQGDLVKAHAVNAGLAEMIEVVVHGDQETSSVVGRAIAELNLPVGVVVMAIMRDRVVHFAKPDFFIKGGDHVLLFVTDKQYLLKIERLFQVKSTYV